MANEDVNLGSDPLGESLLDQKFRANPEMLNKMIEGASMHPKKAFKHVYGEEPPSVFATDSPTWMNFLGMHNKIQDTLVEKALQNITDPTYGRSVGEGAKRMGMAPEDFASPEHIRKVPPAFQGPGKPEITQLGQRTADEMNLGVASPTDISQFMGKQEPMYREGPPLSPPGSPVVNPRTEVDVNAPMGALERASVSSRLKAEQSPWALPSVTRGTAANAERLAQDYYEAVQKYGPNDPRTLALGARAGVLKSTAQAGSTEEKLGKAREGKITQQTRSEKAKADRAPEMEDAKLQNILARTRASNKNTQHIDELIQSRKDLLDSQTRINKMKEAGTFPDQVRADLHEQHMETQRDFIRKVYMAVDKGDITNEEAQDMIRGMLGGFVGLEGEVGKTSKGMFRRMGEATGITEKKQVTPTKPGTQAPPAQGGMSSRGKPTLQEGTKAAANLQALEQMQAEFDKLAPAEQKSREGATLNNGQYVVRGGKIQENK